MYPNHSDPIVIDGSMASMKTLGQRYFKALADASDKWESLRSAHSQETTLDDTAYELAGLTASISAEFLLRPFPPLPEYRPPPTRIDCADPTYSSALTGRPDPENKTIVDMTLFGWDIDLLEIRLLEYSDLIHKFVIVEQTTNLKGVPKPLLIPHLLLGRLAAFKEKIDYVVLNTSHLDPQTVRNDTWAVERHLRDSTGEYVKNTYPPNFYVIQNDGDEIVNRKALAHFKSCQLRNPPEEVRFPALCFKRNTGWLQQVARQDFFGYRRRKHELANYLWAPGPSLHRLSALDPLHIREHPYLPCKHMGMGSANHFSEPSHPIYNFLKKFSTVDSTIQLDHGEFWKKAKEEKLSYADIRGLNHMCHRNAAKRTRMHTRMQAWDSVSDLPRQTQELIKSYLPWALHRMGSRYAWLYHERGFFSQENCISSCICKKDARSCFLAKVNQV